MNDIVSVINTLATNLYNAVEEEVFTLLDELLIIQKEILEVEPLQKLGLNSSDNNIFLLALCFVTMCTICFVIKNIISMYSGEEMNSLPKYVLKLTVYTILSCSAFFICESVLNINELVSEVVKSIGEDVTNREISFKALKEVIENIELDENFLSLDGAIKGMVGFGAISLLFIFCIRYVTIVFLIIISPIAFMFAIEKTTLGLFIKWCKTLISKLFIQNVALIIMIIPLSIENTDSTIFKVMLVGSIYMLYKINNFSTEILSGINIDRRE